MASDSDSDSDTLSSDSLPAIQLFGDALDYQRVRISSMASDSDTFSFDSLPAIQLFVDAARRGILDHESVRISSIRVRDAHAALILLPRQPNNRELFIYVDLTNRAIVRALATTCLMLPAAEVIVDDLLSQVDQRRIKRKDVAALRNNAQFIIQKTVAHDPVFFSFVDDVAKEMLGTADNLKQPRRNFAQLHHGLVNLRTAINALLDRQVQFPPPPEPATGAAVEPLAVEEEEILSPEKLLADAPATGPVVEPLTVEEEVPSSESEKLLSDAPAIGPAIEPLATGPAIESLAVEEEEKQHALEKTLALQEKPAASENPPAPEKAAASEKQKACALHKSLALEEDAAASEKAPANVDLADPEAGDASIATGPVVEPLTAPDAGAGDDE